MHDRMLWQLYIATLLQYRQVGPLAADMPHEQLSGCRRANLPERGHCRHRDCPIDPRSFAGGVACRLSRNDNVVPIRRHGAIVPRPTLKQAVYRAIYDEVNAPLQAGASTWSHRVTAPTRPTTEATGGQTEKPWQLWIFGHARRKPISEFSP